MPKKKKRVIAVLVSFIFFGLLFLNLKYPMRSETSVKSNIMPVAYEPEKAVTENKVDKQQEEAKELAKEPAKEEPAVVPENDSKAEVSQPSSTPKTSTTVNKTTSSTPSTSTQNPKPTPAKPPTPLPAPKPTPPQTPTPALKPFTVPASNSFNDAYQSADPGRAELLIVMDSSDNYEVQLNQLYSVIAPVVGSQLANQIIGYARTKTDAYISLDRSWYVTGRTLELGSTWGDWGVSFYSWRK